MTPFAERYNYFINTCLSQTLLPEKSTPSYEAVYEEINCNSSISIDEFKQMIAGNIEPTSEVKYAISDMFGLNTDWMVKGSKTAEIFAQGMRANYNPLSIFDFPDIKQRSIIIGLYFMDQIRYALVVIKESEFRYKYVTPRFVFHLGEGAGTLNRTADFYRFMAQADAKHLLYEHVYIIDENIANSIILRKRHPSYILKGTEIERFIYNIYYWDYNAWTLGYDRSRPLINYINRVKKEVDELNKIDNRINELLATPAKRSDIEYPSDTNGATYRNNDIETELPFDEEMGNLRNKIYTKFDLTVNCEIDYRSIARRYDVERPIFNKLLQSIIKALEEMQNVTTYHRSKDNSKDLEDRRNRFVSAQLRAAGFNCSDQQTGGISADGDTVGKRDFVVKDKDNRDVLVYEGLNTDSLRKDYINKHIAKLVDNYNPLGLRQGVLVVYLECTKEMFTSFSKRYREHISEYAPENYSCLGEPEDIPTSGQFMTCMAMNYEVGEVLLQIFHIIVRVAP